jgi:hypothetical protein
MRRVTRAFAVFLAFAPGPDVALAGDVERAQILIESVGFDDPRAAELHDLARKPAVRKWLRARVRELWKDEDDSNRVEPYFLVLARTGGGREEVQFLVDAAARRTDNDYSYFSRYSQRLLERAPLALDVEPLLDLLARRAASSFHDNEAANSLWLLAHRLPRDRVERALEAAWKGAPAFASRKTSSGWAHAELTLLGPDGKPPEGLLWIRDVGAWNPSQQVVWPDGKARLGHWLRDQEPAWEAQIQITLPGFKENQKTQVNFRKGEVTRAEIRLGERRAWVRGRLTPAPAAPLFARLHSGLTVGDALDPYHLSRGELSIPVRPDGAFQAPTNSRGKALLILDVDGNVHHVQPVEVAEGGADTDLGEVKLAAQRNLVDVPLYVDWPPALPRGGNFQGNLTWKSEDPSVPRGGTYFSAGSGKQGEKKVFVGLARNVPPGNYTVGARFHREQDQGEVAPFEMSLIVKGVKDELVLKPGKGAPAPAPTPAAPTGAGVPVAHGSQFVLRRSPQGQVHLLTADSRSISHRVRDGETFGAERVLFKSPAGALKVDDALTGWTTFIDLVPEKDGGFHVFRLTGVTANHRALYYARVARAAGQPPRWTRIADDKSQSDDYAEPTVLAKKNGSLEVFSPVLRLHMEDESRGTLGGMRLFRGIIQGGRLRALPTIRLEEGNVPITSNAKVVGAPEDDPHALYAKPGGALAWTSLGRLQEQPAGSVPDANYFQEAATALAPGGVTYLVLALQDAGEPHPSFWIGSARTGERFAEKGILKGLFTHRLVNLIVAPRGEVYLLTSVRQPGKDDGQIVLWNLSGEFPPAPLLTPWLDRSSAAPRAVFLDEREVLLAWSRNDDIHVETFALPER